MLHCGKKHKKIECPWNRVWVGRIMMRDIAVVIMCIGAVFALAFLGVARAGGPIGSRLTEEEARTLIVLHNKARADVGNGPLAWSKSLAVYAQSWADHLASTSCRMEHRPRSGKWKQVYGENLLIGTVGYHGVTDAVRAWEKEKSLYHGDVINASNWYPSGHFTQMVWKDTRHIGCAKAECRGKVIVVCNYDPPGNVIGEKPY
jgi:pathogenesis-related protein 1